MFEPPEQTRRFKREQTRENVCGLCLNANGCSLVVAVRQRKLKEKTPPKMHVTFLFSYQIIPLRQRCKISQKTLREEKAELEDRLEKVHAVIIETFQKKILRLT